MTEGTAHTELRTSRSMKTYVFSFGFIAACLAVLIVYLFASGDVRLLPEAFAWPRSLWLVLGVLLMAGSLLVESKVLADMAETLSHPISMRMAFRATMVVQFFNNVTPSSSGGQPMQIWSLWRDGMSVSDATVIQLGKYVIYQSTLALCCLVALLFDYRELASAIGGWRVLFVVSFVIQMCILAFVLLLILRPRSMRWIVNFFSALLSHTPLRARTARLFARLNSELDRYESSAGILVADARTIGRFFGVTLLQLLLFYSVPFCICQSLGVSIPYWRALAAAAFVLMVSGIVPLPGASGGAEGTFLLVFGQFFPAGTSVAVAILLWRILTFYLPIVCGAPFCTSIGRARRQAATLEQDAARQQVTSSASSADESGPAEERLDEPAGTPAAKTTPMPAPSAAPAPHPEDGAETEAEKPTT